MSAKTGNTITSGSAKGWLVRKKRKDGTLFPSWYLNGRVGEPGRWTAFEVSMETPSLVVARGRAGDFLRMKDGEWKESGESKWARLAAGLGKQGTRGWPMVSAVCERYLEGAAPGKLAGMRKNVNSLRAIVEQGTGRPVGEVSVVEVSLELAHAWARMRQEYQRLLIELEEALELRDALGWREIGPMLGRALNGRRAGCVDPAVGLLQRARESYEADPVGAGAMCQEAGRGDIGGLMLAAAAEQGEVRRLEGLMDWKRLRAVAGTLPKLDPDTRAAGNVTINSMLAQAGSIFCGKSRQYRLEGLELPPGVEGFAQVARLAEESTAFVPIPPEAYAAMEAGSHGLAGADAEVWRVHVLVRRLGLRAGEVVAADRSWIERDLAGFRHQVRGGALLVVRDRGQAEGDEGGFRVKAKTGKARYLPLDEEATGLFEGRTGGLVADTKAGAARAVRRHNAWLRQFIPDRVKAGHELRKHVGALIFTRHGSAAAAEYLGNTPAMVERTYSAYITGLPVLSAADLSAGALRRES